MNHTDQRLEQIASRARNAAPPAAAEMPFGFATRVLANVRPACDSSAQWVRLSLASLPFGALAMVACLYWFGADLPKDAHDLAEVFVQSRLLP